LVVEQDFKKLQNYHVDMAFVRLRQPSLY
jgi:hypothetical protein